MRSRCIPWLAALLLGTTTSAEAQIDILRRARDRAEDVASLPSLNDLLRTDPPLTTSLEDAEGEAAVLDGFEPSVFSPLAEMPRGPGGIFLIAPGSYTFEAQSYCLMAGTYGPREGNGYLYAPLLGPQAGVIRAILARSADQPDIPQEDVQRLLWAIITRTKLTDMPRERQRTAALLLTPQELLSINGYALQTLPNAIRDRLLKDLPAPVRRVLEAENELRRLNTRADASLEDLERVAVLIGVVPPEEDGRYIPSGRWSYHPNGYFIRYLPDTYRRTRIDVYYPESVRIERDEQGRIRSITGGDGSRLEVTYAPRGLVQAAGFAWGEDRPLRAVGFTWQGGAAAARSNVRGWWTKEVTVPNPAWPGAAGWHRRAYTSNPSDAAVRARADLLDLLHYRSALESGLGSDSTPAALQARALAQAAVHVALARSHGVAHRKAHRHGSDAALRLWPNAYGGRLAYWIAPDGTEYDGSFPQPPVPFRPLEPGDGAAVPSVPRQRLGPSGRESKREGDSLDQARRFTNMFSGANEYFGLATDLAGFVGSFIPTQIFSRGLDWGYDKSRGISDGMQGVSAPTYRTGPDLPNPVKIQDYGSWRPWSFAGPPILERVGGPSMGDPYLALVVDSRPGVGLLSHALPQGPVYTGAADYQALARPRRIEFERLPARDGIPAAHAETINDLIETTLALGAMLEALQLSGRRYAAAQGARDAQWTERHAQALIHLKRESGLLMLQWADRADSLQQSAQQAGIREVAISSAQVAAAQQELRAQGFSRVVLEVDRRLGRTAEETEASRQRLLAADPRLVASQPGARFTTAAAEMRAYGAYWSSLPEIAAPWTEGFQ
jgi:hypothetical protein